MPFSIKIRWKYFLGFYSSEILILKLVFVCLSFLKSKTK